SRCSGHCVDRRDAAGTGAQIGQFRHRRLLRKSLAPAGRCKDSWSIRAMSTSSLKEQSLREEICRVGASLYQRNYAVGSAGNVGARLDDGWLITPTDACLGMLDPAQIAKVDGGGQWISGDRPSKTLTLHRAVYDNNPTAQSVLHTHSTNLVALTLAGVWST